MNLFSTKICQMPSHSRQYKSGTTWCLWRWTENEYAPQITRLHIIKTPWFAVCLHWINGPDPEAHLHDHPVTFLSLILRGWYTEHREKLISGVWVLSFPRHEYFNFIRARWGDTHKITNVSPGGCLTLVFMGPKRRDWGFHVWKNNIDNWVLWKDYYAGRK